MSAINLKQLSENIKGQDNRSTASPLYCIYDVEYVVIDSEYSSRFDTQYVWVSDEGCSYSEDDSEFDALEVLCGDNEITIDGIKYEKVRQSIVPRFVTACLTEVGANNYLQANGQNLSKPYIYVHSLNRNDEMIGLRNFITDTFWESSK